MSTSARHTTAEQRALYVMDALELDPRERLEAHVLTCPTCHAALLEEARVEMTLRELCSPPLVTAPAAAPRPLIDQGQPPEGAWRRQPVRLAFFALATAAALVMLFRTDPTVPPQRWPVTAERRLSENSAMEQELTLQEQAEKDGALVCDRLPLPRVCSLEDPVTSARLMPAALQDAICDPAVPIGAEKITCALPAAGAESSATCGP